MRREKKKKKKRNINNDLQKKSWKANLKSCFAKSWHSTFWSKNTPIKILLSASLYLVRGWGVLTWLGVMAVCDSKVVFLDCFTWVVFGETGVIEFFVLFLLPLGLPHFFGWSWIAVGSKAGIEGCWFSLSSESSAIGEGGKREKNWQLGLMCAVRLYLILMSKNGFRTLLYWIAIWKCQKLFSYPCLILHIKFGRQLLILSELQNRPLDDNNNNNTMSQTIEVKP